MSHVSCVSTQEKQLKDQVVAFSIVWELLVEGEPLHSPG